MVQKIQINDYHKEHLQWLSQDSEDRLNPTEMIKSYLNDYAIMKDAPEEKEVAA